MSIGINSVKDNERLEFLGDAVFELAVSQYLYRHFTDMREGKLIEISCKYCM